MNLNFNCMFILVLMLRKCLTYLRATPLANFLPLDQNIQFHKLVGSMIAFYGIVHTLAHVGNARKYMYYVHSIFTVYLIYTNIDKMVSCGPEF
jgi:hypothetical protein